MNSLEAANYEVRLTAVLISFRHNAAYFVIYQNSHVILLCFLFLLSPIVNTSYILMLGQNSLIYKYIIEYDKCREDYEKNHKGKDKSMMRELNKYLVRRRKK